jgi:hypothetical protein
MFLAEALRREDLLWILLRSISPRAGETFVVLVADRCDLSLPASPAMGEITVKITGRIMSKIIGSIASKILRTLDQDL